MQEQALEEEDYEVAAALRDNVGLMYKGWWYGSSSGDTEPHLLRVEPCYGRLGGFWVSLADILSVEVSLLPRGQPDGSCADTPCRT